jgi:hypothetical protein
VKQLALVILAWVMILGVIQAPKQLRTSVKTEVPVEYPRVLSGTLLDYQKLDDCLVVSILTKHGTYSVNLTPQTFIVSHRPRIEHTMVSLMDWLKGQPKCFITVGCHKGIASDVIFLPDLPEEDQNSD